LSDCEHQGYRVPDHLLAGLEIADADALAYDIEGNLLPEHRKMSSREPNPIEVFNATQTHEWKPQDAWIMNTWGKGYREIPYGAKSYDEVQAKVDTVGEANKARIQAEKEYLYSHGFKLVIDHENETVRWQASGEYGKACFTRKAAVDYVRNNAANAKVAAEREIDRLKTKHGIREASS
jgi:hypothetical protein